MQAQSEPEARTAKPAKARGTLLWDFLVGLVVLGVIAAWLHTWSQKYAVRARLSEGLLVASELQRAVMEVRERGATDLTCDTERCNLVQRPPAPRGSVAAVQVSRSGVITVEYRDASLPVNQRRLLLWPQIDGKDADLSNKATAGRAVTWQCGRRPQTTVPEDLLPTSCK
jgi:hypothetical protein